MLDSMVLDRQVEEKATHSSLENGDTLFEYESNSIDSSDFIGQKEVSKNDKLGLGGFHRMNDERDCIGRSSLFDA